MDSARIDVLASRALVSFVRGAYQSDVLWAKLWRAVVLTVLFQFKRFALASLSLAVAIHWLTAFSPSCFSQELSVRKETAADQIEELERIAAARRTNRERISRWEGDAEVLTVSSFGDATIHSTAEVHFVYDRNKDACQYVYNVVAWNSIPENAPAYPSMLGFRAGDLLLGTKMYSLLFNDWDHRSTDFVTVYQRREQKVNFFGPQFYPLHFLGVGSEPEETKIKRWQKYLGPGFDFFDSAIETQSNGQITVKETDKNLPIEVWWIGTFDMNQGGSFVHSEQDIPDIESSRYDVEYQEFNGIFVPKFWHRRLDRIKQGTGVEVTVRFIRQTVNGELPPKAFTLEFMGVRPGSKLSDHGTSSTTTYQPEESATTDAKKEAHDDVMPTPAVKKSSNTPSASQGMVSKLVIAGVCVALFVLIAYFVMSKAVKK